MKSPILWILIKKNIKFTFKNFYIISAIVIFHLIQMVTSKNVYENFLGSYGGKTIGYTEIEILGQTGSIAPLTFYAAAVLVQLIFFGAIISTSLSVSEKETHTLLRIMASPVNRLQVILGNIFGSISVMLILSGVFILLTNFFLGVNWGNSWLNLFILTLIVSFVSTALSMAAFSAFKDTKLAASVVSFIVVVMVFVSGSISAGMQYSKVSKFTLNKWAFEALIDVMNGNSLAKSATNLMILTISAIVLMIITFTMFGRENSIE